MCLTIPALVKSIEGNEADVEIGGISRRVSLWLTPEAKVGDYVLLHTGYAISVIDQEEAEQNQAIAPFGSGCSTIVQYPYLERSSNHPRAVIGMFDISARPFVHRNTLTFSVPMNKFVMMTENMEESFLITQSWAKVQKRIE
jgi:hydrogenase assembly chaperone HypC/HupF